MESMSCIEQKITVTGVEIVSGILTFRTKNGAFNCRCISGKHAKAIIDFFNEICGKSHPIKDQ